jgi:hypothetical protein
MHSSPEPALGQIVVTTPELYGKPNSSQSVALGGERLKLSVTLEFTLGHFSL